MPLFGPNTSRVNLDDFKLTRTLVFYYESHNYLEDIAVTGAQALRALDELPSNAMDATKSAIVLDIDETSLLNDWPRLIRPGTDGAAGDKPFRYDPDCWNEWIEKARAKACAT